MVKYSIKAVSKCHTILSSLATSLNFIIIMLLLQLCLAGLSQIYRSKLTHNVMYFFTQFISATAVRLLISHQLAIQENACGQVVCLIIFTNKLKKLDAQNTKTLYLYLSANLLVLFRPFITGHLSIREYSRTLIIQTPICHFCVKGVQISEFACVRKLSDKIHYLASQLASYIL